MALPGVLTLLSVLAVILGSPPQAHQTQPRMTAGSVAPSLPELRPAPQPAPVVPLPAAPPPEPYQLPAVALGTSAPIWHWTAPRWAPDLAWLGRLQTDGG